MRRLFSVICCAVGSGFLFGPHRGITPPGKGLEIISGLKPAQLPTVLAEYNKQSTPFFVWFFSVVLPAFFSFLARTPLCELRSFPALDRTGPYRLALLASSRGSFSALGASGANPRFFELLGGDWGTLLVLHFFQQIRKYPPTPSPLAQLCKQTFGGEGVGGYLAKADSFCF